MEKRLKYINASIKQLKLAEDKKNFIQKLMQTREKYQKLIKADTPYSKKMTVLRNRIFGDVVKNTDKSSMKIVKMLSEEPIYMKNEVINYYPKHREFSTLIKILSHYGLFYDDHDTFTLEMQKSRAPKVKKIQKEASSSKKEKTEESTKAKESKKLDQETKINNIEQIPLYIKVDLK